MRPKKQSTRLKRMSVKSDATTEDEIVQPTKNLMIAAQKLIVMIVMMEMTLVVVQPHLPHKEEVMSDLSLPSRPISSHIAPRMKTTTSRHRQEFQ
jgi:hypothetical protein